MRQFFLPHNQRNEILKKMGLVLVLAAFALSGSAFAQDPLDFNYIGLFLTPAGYLDPIAHDGSGSCGAVLEDSPFTAFVVLSKLTNPQVWGWEAKIYPDNMLELGVTVYGNHVDAGSRPNEHIVGLATPLNAVNGAVVVAEIQYLVSSLSNDINFPSYAVVEGVYFSLIDPIQGFPAYLEAPGSPGVALHGTLGHPSQDGLPQLIMNGDCLGVGVEDASFGSVKSLYR